MYRILNGSNNREVVCPIYTQIFPLESIYCSEQIVTDSGILQWEKYVDMESYWIDYIATKHTIPYLSIKLPFDTVSKGSTYLDINEMQTALEVLDYNKIMKSISAYLDKNIKVDIKSWDFEYYKNYFWFTFSENLIFIKNYNKFNAFGKNFEDFFEKNKNLSKKNFLEKMK